MRYSQELRDKLKKLLEKATPLPWINMKDDTFYGQIRSNNEDTFTEIARMPKYDDRENDFDLIEAAVNNLSDLLEEIDRLTAAHKWVSVSEKPVIDDGENRITVFVLWEWDSEPGKLYPGIGEMFIDESKVMVSDGDFDKEVVYWQYILPTPPTGGENDD